MFVRAESTTCRYCTPPPAPSAEDVSASHPVCHFVSETDHLVKPESQRVTASQSQAATFSLCVCVVCACHGQPYQIRNTHSEHRCVCCVTLLRPSPTRCVCVCFPIYFTHSHTRLCLCFYEDLLINQFCVSDHINRAVNLNRK